MDNIVWIIGIIILVAIALFVAIWWRRRTRTLFHELIKMFPSVSDSETLARAENEAFGNLGKFLLDGVRVDIVSKSRIAQLKKIRSDLKFIESELKSNRFVSYPELRQIWEFTLHKAAAHIADDYKFDEVAEKLAKMRKQIEKLSPPEKD